MSKEYERRVSAAKEACMSNGFDLGERLATSGDPFWTNWLSFEDFDQWERQRSAKKALAEFESPLPEECSK